MQQNPLQTQILPCISSTDIITVQYIACTETRAVGGIQQAPPTTGCLQKLQEGVDTRPDTLHKEREQQKLLHRGTMSHWITAQIGRIT
ncbi:unnamed protein product [Staurois parvus]|uniref:Uncharacterized protein n=1 Tax=Staurois parvus TaxID=386267 RepID=A0ABN9CZ81_9NEOB|nr:unnamed protein product [Staurois parvus]